MTGEESKGTTVEVLPVLFLPEYCFIKEVPLNPDFCNASMAVTNV